jgi:hypothetical protein
MAQEKVGLRFIKNLCGINASKGLPSQNRAVGAKSCILNSIIDNLIKPICVKECCLNSIIGKDVYSSETIQSTYNHCQGLITIADFLKLV